MEIDVAKIIPPPVFPTSESWEASIAQLVRGTGKVPRIATKPLGLFDRFGAVKFGPDEVGFDNDEVSWDKVTELRTWKLSSLLTGQAIDREVDRIRGYLPPIPGRKWAVEKTVNLLLDLILAVAGEQAKIYSEAVNVISSSAAEEVYVGHEVPEDDRVVAEIEYRGRLGTKELRGGLVSTLLLAKVPGANDCLCKWAEMKGIPVVLDEDEEHFDVALERGLALRARFESLAERALRLRNRDNADKDSDNDDDAPDPEAQDEALPAPEPPSISG